MWACISPCLLCSSLAACIPVRHHKGDSDPRIRQWLARHGIKAVIPRRKDQKPDDKRARLDEEAYKRRSVVEQCVG